MRNTGRDMHVCACTHARARTHARAYLGVLLPPLMAAIEVDAIGAAVGIADRVQQEGVRIPCTRCIFVLF